MRYFLSQKPKQNQESLVVSDEYYHITCNALDNKHAIFLSKYIKYSSISLTDSLYMFAYMSLKTICLQKHLEIYGKEY